MIAGCPNSPYGEAGFTQRQVRARDSAAILEVHVVESTETERPVGPAALSIHIDTLARDIHTRTFGAITDSLGRARISAVPPGRYGLLVRALGYDSFRAVLTVRDSSVDSLVVRLRGTPLCTVTFQPSELSDEEQQPPRRTIRLLRKGSRI